LLTANGRRGNHPFYRGASPHPGRHADTTAARDPAVTSLKFPALRKSGVRATTTSGLEPSPARGSREGHSHRRRGSLPPHRHLPSHKHLPATADAVAGRKL